MDLNNRLSRLRQWMRHGYGSPYIVELRLTQRCNLKCRFCATTVSTYDYSIELDVNKLLEAVRDAAELGVERWVIVGDGEPTYRLKDCLAVMRAVKSHGMRGSMLTNGTMLTTESIREMTGMGWDHICISLDGPNPDINDNLRGVSGAFSRAVLTIERINRAKSEAGSLLPVLDIQTVITARNFTVLEDMIHLAAENGIGRVTFQPVVYHQGADRSLLLPVQDVQELKRSIPDVLRAAESRGVHTNLAAFLERPMIEHANSMTRLLVPERIPEHPLLAYPCYEPWYLIAIRPDGGVDPCPHVRADPSSNLRRHSLRELWTGRYFTGFRERIAGKGMFKECDKCCSVGVIHNQEMRQMLEGDLYAIRSQGLQVPFESLSPLRGP